MPSSKKHLSLLSGQLQSACHVTAANFSLHLHQKWTTGLLMFLTTFENHADNKHNTWSLQAHLMTWQSNRNQCVTKRWIGYRSIRNKRSNFQSYQKTRGVIFRPIKNRRSKFRSWTKLILLINFRISTPREDSTEQDLMLGFYGEGVCTWLLNHDFQPDGQNYSSRAA